MSDPRLVGLCGALRRGSTNRLLLKEAVRLFGPCDFAEGDLRLPLYDGDLEDAGMPEPVSRLAAQVAGADAVILASPEYNRSMTGVLKNALDWISRVKGRPFRDKPVAIISAADGRGGGDRGQFSLRLGLVAFRPRLLQGPEIMVADSSNAFTDAGRLRDERTVKLLTELMAALRAEIGRPG